MKHDLMVELPFFLTNDLKIGDHWMDLFRQKRLQICKLRHRG